MNALMPPSAAEYEATTTKRAAAGTIDDPKNMATQNAFLFSGTKDTTVKQVRLLALGAHAKRKDAAAEYTIWAVKCPRFALTHACLVCAVSGFPTK